MSLGSVAVPPGLPEATVRIIRVHVRGLTNLRGGKKAESSPLHLAFDVWPALSPHYLPECQPIGTVQGLDIMSAGYHYMYFFFT